MKKLTIVGGGGFAGEVAAYVRDVAGLRDLELRGYVALERSRLPILQEVPYLGQETGFWAVIILSMLLTALTWFVLWKKKML